MSMLVQARVHLMADYGEHNLIASCTGDGQEYTYREIIEIRGKSREDFDRELKEALDEIDAARATRVAAATGGNGNGDFEYATTFTDTTTGYDGASEESEF